MLKKTVILLVALSAMAFAQTAQADDTLATASQTSAKALTSHAVQKPLDTVKPKKPTSRLIGTQPPKAQSQATRAKSHGRFVIGTNNTNKAMTVYRSKNTRKAMPNLFKN